jgi:hypothetical protein
VEACQQHNGESTGCSGAGVPFWRGSHAHGVHDLGAQGVQRWAEMLPAPSYNFTASVHSNISQRQYLLGSATGGHRSPAIAPMQQLCTRVCPTFEPVNPVWNFSPRRASFACAT